jgi:hypothetical protein
MHSLLTGRPRDVAAALRSAAMTVGMLSGLLTPFGALAADTRSAAWDQYSQASETLADCRMRGRTPPPCTAEKAAAIAAEARYRAEVNATEATRP